MTTPWTSAAGTDHVAGRTPRRYGWTHWSPDGRPKVPYGRRSLAEHHARRMTAQQGWTFWAYACRCGAWHIGQTDPAEGW